jgi:hypothetical protein
VTTFRLIQFAVGVVFVVLGLIDITAALKVGR